MSKLPADNGNKIQIIVYEKILYIKVYMAKRKSPIDIDVLK